MDIVRKFGLATGLQRLSLTRCYELREIKARIMVFSRTSCGNPFGEDGF